ncbi:MAG: cell wall-binding repeat-containing protein [Actinomycetota bacterium]|nr:cell wall-binding repeat-containing protein [Actinomycetota bacterium]MDP3631513.1 cell wall-binding repeat-containing protein [Actinomycetota bacterium]
MRKRYLRAILAIMVLLSLAISPAMSFAGDAKTPDVRGIRPAANLAPADTYEPDNAPATANQISAIPAAGYGFYTQAHTITNALDNICDVDWYYFDVAADEIAIDEVKFLIEAVSYDTEIDLVVEVYATGTSIGDPVFGGGWTLDPAAIAKDDDSFGTRNPAAEFIPSVAGRYWVRVRPYYSYGSTRYTNHAGYYTFKIQRTLSERIAGSDRINTAIEVSKKGLTTYPVASITSRTILLANSLTYPDALSGAALVSANGYGGSLLLTPQNSLPTAVRNEIIRTGAKNVYILGGTGAVSDTVKAQVQAINAGLVVKRVAGDDRIKTSVAIARENYTKLGIPRRFAIVAYAFNYPDALAATPIAAWNSMPVFLTATNSLSPETELAMDDIGVTDIIIVGGTGAVSANVANQCAVHAGGTDHVLRIAGSTRYDTAKEIALWACDKKGPGTLDDGFVGTVANPAGLNRLVIAHIGLASGENFPDALSGGVLCGINAHPLLLTPKASLSPYIYDIYLDLPVGATDFFNEAGSPPITGQGLVFGGTGAVETLPLLIFSMMQGF